MFFHSLCSDFLTVIIKQDKAKTPKKQTLSRLANKKVPVPAGTGTLKNNQSSFLTASTSLGESA